MKKDIETNIAINATPEKVWRILTDFPAFPEWNPFVIRAEGKPEEGEVLEIDVQIPEGGKQRFTPLVLKVEPLKELRWAGNLPLNMFRGEHFYMIDSLDERRVNFIHGEHFSGWLVRLIWFFQGKKIEKGYELMNQALKQRAERN